MAKKVFIYLLVGIGTIAGIAAVLNVFMTFFVGGRQVTVPDVRGLREHEAVSMLREGGLKCEVAGQEFSVEYAESTVSSQTPPPGKVVKQGRKIAVTVSMGGEFHDVPYCIGKPLRTARIILERTGLVVGKVARVPTLRGYPDEVLSTEPLPGIKVVTGSPVNILVNNGFPEPRVLLPDLRGKTFVTVKMKLEKLGVFVRESTFDEEFVPLRARIVMQEPPAGHIVSRGDTVTLVITSKRGEGYSL